MNTHHIKTLVIALAATFAFNAQAAEIPNSATLKYSGSYGIPATMTFKRSGNQYTVVANINVPLYKIRFESGGSINGNQLIPSYYKDIRNGKTYASATMSGKQITYGKAGESQTKTVNARVMDLFTLSWQLAFTEGKMPSGIKVTNGKKLYNIGGLSSAGNKQISLSGGKTTVKQVRLQRGDDTVQYAFATKLGNIPAIINYKDGDKNYHLTLKSVSINGQTVKPQ